MMSPMTPDVVPVRSCGHLRPLKSMAMGLITDFFALSPSITLLQVRAVIPHHRL